VVLPSVHRCRSCLPNQWHPGIKGEKKRDQRSVNTRSRVGSWNDMQVTKYPFLPSVHQIQSRPGERRGQELATLPTSPHTHLHHKNITALQDHEQYLEEETGFGIPLEIPPHVCSHTLIGSLFSSLHLNSPSLQQKGAPPTPQVPRRAIWCLLSHLLSFQPWDTLDKKKRRTLR